jgi:hypothetical protein
MDSFRGASSRYSNVADMPNVVPVSGQAVPVSGFKLAAGIALLCLALVLGIVLIWAWWKGIDLPLPLFGERNRNAAAIAGAFMVVMAALFLPIAIIYSFAREKLILGTDRLQIVQYGKVCVQIPARNIARIAIDHDEGVAFLGIDLKNPDDVETFAEGWDFKENKSAGWHYRLSDFYQLRLDEVCALIVERMGEAK